MLRFDYLIRPSMTVRDVKTEHPETRLIFEGLGFREACDDCSIEVVARRQGLPIFEVIDALNAAIATSDTAPE
jgi:hypothetical protein